jgi:uncharacterized membrane protein YcaP (DUF421 family)
MWPLLLRSLFAYLLILLVMRLMGKREIGKLSVFDLAVFVMIADLAVIIIEDTRVPLIKGLIPIATLLLGQLTLSYLSLKSTRLRQLVDGQPSILIKNGRIMEEEMAKQRYNLDDLMTQLREKNISDIADVEFAILETSGKLSVIPRTSVEEGADPHEGTGFRPFMLPVTLIIDGKVKEEGLHRQDAFLVEKPNPAIRLQGFQGDIFRQHRLQRSAVY